MSRIEEIGSHALWIAGHLLFTTILNLTLVGGWYAYGQYQALQPVRIDITQLTQEDKQALANALVDDGTSVPRETNKRKG